MIKLLDTCTILDLQKDAFQSKFLLSSITLSELESIKTSGTKDEETKRSARQILHMLQENEDKYKIIVYNSQVDEELIKKFGLIQNNDSRIIAAAYRKYQENNDIVFVTSDMACKAVANSIGLPTQFALTDCKDDNYFGYKEIQMNDNELANFYSQILVNGENPFELKINEYLLIADSNNKIVDKYKWVDNNYIKVPFYKAESHMFGKVAPKNQDVYQQIALDSLKNNQITMLRGPAGSGKSYLALGYLMSQLEHGNIDKIIIFVNNVAVKGAAKLGFYPGSKDDKLLDSQIGNFLISKFGSITEVEKMIDSGTLILVPVADCRGMDITGMKAGCYVTEAQNLSRDMIKLILQRIGEDSIAIFEGDDKTQVDMTIYSGSNNGLRAMSRAFRGQDIYGEVTLKTIHRSKIAQIAELI